MASNGSIPFNITSAECDILQKIRHMQNDVYSKRYMEKIILITLYSIVCSIGTIGNLLVILATWRSKHLRNLRNFFIFHLACSDLVLCLVTAPTTLHLTFNLFWELGSLNCKLVASIQAFNIFISSLTLTAIALDRYLLIIFPVRFRTQSKAPPFIVLSFVWIIAVTLAAPYFFAVGQVGAETFYPWNMPSIRIFLTECDFDRPNLCIEMFWEGRWFSREVFTITIFVLQYLIPLSALAFVYAHIGKQTIRSRPATLRRRNQNKDRRRKRRTLLLLSSLVTVFAICWLPTNLYCTLTALNLLQFDQHTYIYFHLIGMVTAGANPLMYGLFNSNFRKVYLDMLGPVIICRAHRQNTTEDMENEEGSDSQLENARSDYIPLHGSPEVTKGMQRGKSLISIPLKLSREARTPSPNKISMNHTTTE